MDRENGLTIHHKLKSNGSSFTAVANSLEPKVTPQAVWNVAFGLRSTPRIRAAISKAVNEPVEELWPDMEKAA